MIGGGNTAVDVAREAVRLGADAVALVYRRTEAEMPAFPHEVVEAREEGVRFLWLPTPVRFARRRPPRRRRVRRMRLGEPDDERPASSGAGRRHASTSSPPTPP